MGSKDDQRQAPTLPTHGARVLPSVTVESYSCEIEDDDGFVGDRASKSAFKDSLESIRKLLAKNGEDPFDGKDIDELTTKKLGSLLADGDPEAGAVVQSAIEEFAQQLASVTRRFMRLKSWKDIECIVVGGGFRGSRVGELAIARAGILLKAGGIDVDFQLIHNEPNDAGLLGAAHLLPAWMIDGHDAILAVDVGGTNIRAGLVELNIGKKKDLSKARIRELELWRHADESDLKRDEAVGMLAKMLTKLLREAGKMRIAPVVGIGCPGLIQEDGSIASGAQNLPGNWESSKFNLPRSIREHLPSINEHETLVVMHNDAVVQGLSELPYLEKRKRWAALTIGTGLGNVSYARRA